MHGCTGPPENDFRGIAAIGAALLGSAPGAAAAAGVLIEGKALPVRTDKAAN
jgi:hypothetical protein